MNRIWNQTLPLQQQRKTAISAATLKTQFMHSYIYTLQIIINRKISQYLLPEVAIRLKQQALVTTFML